MFLAPGLQNGFAVGNPWVDASTFPTPPPGLRHLHELLLAPCWRRPSLRLSPGTRYGHERGPTPGRDQWEITLDQRLLGTFPISEIKLRQEFMARHGLAGVDMYRRTKLPFWSWEALVSWTPCALAGCWVGSHFLAKIGSTPLSMVLMELNSFLIWGL